MTEPLEIAPARAKVNAWLAYIAGPIAYTGVQLISPTLPVLQTDLDLTNSELALVTSVYLFPAALFALPTGILADRWGRRRVLGWSAIVFGICGGLYIGISDSFLVFLSVRFVQGLAFAAILPLTITILGDTYRGLQLVRAQGYRMVATGLGEAVLPIIGGFLAAVRWDLAWTLQAAALPFGIVVLVFMEDSASRTNQPILSRGRDLVTLMRSSSIVALEWIGVQRMFVKFALLTFLPVYFVAERGFSTEFTGLVIGVSGGTGVAFALLAARITRHGSLVVWVWVSMSVIGIAVVVYIVAAAPWLILTFAVLHGAAEGVTGVLANSLVAVAAKGNMRASFVAATGALRNFAKFLAPTAFGALVLVLPLGVSFIILGVVSTAASATARLLAPLETKLVRDQPSSP